MSDDRAARLTQALAPAGVDALLVTALVNVRYLTGYSGSNGLALVGPQSRTFVTDFRYVEQAADEVSPSFDRLTASDAGSLVDAFAATLPPGSLRLGFERDHVSVAEHERLRERLPAAVELVGMSGLVEQLRAVKEPAELERIRAATELADESFRRVLERGLIGRTEREVAIALEFEMRDQGARRPSFDSIVAAGPHGALPHAQPRDHTIRAGELVVIDWGAEVDGYCSDCTRTPAAGEPDSEAREAYELVSAAQLAGLEAVKPGEPARDADTAARRIIDAAGHKEHFGHGLGHGVGLEIHEGPTLKQRSDDVLRPGNVVTVEPGVYLPGRLGIRIEDLVAVTDRGADILTGIDKRLIVTD